MTARLLVQRAPGEALRDFSLFEKAALTGEITVAYLHVRWLMRRGDFRGAVAAVRARGRRGGEHAPDGGIDFAGRLGSIVDARLRLLPGDTRCLVRSLVLLKLLARRGQEGKLVIGVRTEPEFGAHAWVELDGRSLLQPMEASGERLTEL